MGSTAIRRCIKEDKTDQIISLMQTSRQDGMITMDQCLEELVIARKIAYDEGYKNAEDKKDFQKRLEQRIGKQNAKAYGISSQDDKNEQKNSDKRQ